MSRLASVVFAAALTTVACNPTRLKPGYCHSDKDCAGKRCDVDASWKCVDPDAGMPMDADGGDGGDARDVADEPKFSCNQCEAGANNVCDMDASRCVGCLGDGDCGADGSLNKVCDLTSFKCVGCLPTNNPCTGTTPICSNMVCRPCAEDRDCASGVCMVDGHCAGSSEIIFVEYSSSGCPGADGSSTKPYCTPNDAVSQLVSGKNVIVVRGPTADRLTLNTTGVAPVIVGKPGASSAGASIPATAATAIQVLSDAVLIRDLAVTGGTAATSRGIVVSGASSALTLVNVRVELTTGGLGVQAETGAQLTMDRCTILNNPVGGLLINGAGYSIENCVFAANGYGIQFNAPKSASQFRFNTVVGTVASFCDLANPQTLSSSIVVGANTNCSLLECVTTMPAFSASRPYRLTAKLPCPNADASSFPDHDIDNDPRTVSLDCGADQFVQ